MVDLFMHLFLGVAIVAPFVCALVVAVSLVIAKQWLSESVVVGTIRVGLTVSLLASLGAIATFLGAFGSPIRGEIEYGNWLAVGDYAIPLTLLVDPGALVFSLLAAVLTLLVARFSRTYLHKEPGFDRFFFLIGIFAAGTQLIAFAGALDLFFAGWELIGISSALFIGFYHERDEPVRSSVRAFATYRLCDMGLLIAIVTIHELLGSTKLSALNAAGSLPALESSAIAALLLLAAMGKSAQLPFSGWLPRAMEGPTPSSALFYGAVSIHAGLYLLLRVSAVFDVSPYVAAFGVFVGVATALYASAIARIHTDAKGALAHATLAQIGLILAEISLGLTTLALIHLSCHAMLRVYQYLRTPNMIHDAHTAGHGHHHSGSGWLTKLAPKTSERVYGAALHRWRLDERVDAAVAPALGLARWLDRVDHRVRSSLSLDARS
ncbi:MAG: proton-conducting transporter membrane subunit [Gemmatimonadaceae bacterium]